MGDFGKLAIYSWFTSNSTYETWVFFHSKNCDLSGSAKVGIKVFQGEREMAADNQMLGQFDLVGAVGWVKGMEGRTGGGFFEEWCLRVFGMIFYGGEEWLNMV